MPELTDTSDLKQRILEESKEYIVLPPQEGEFTIKDFIEAYGDDINYDRAFLVLKKMLKDGKIYKRVGMSPGTHGRCNIYGWE